MNKNTSTAKTPNNPPDVDVSVLERKLGYHLRMADRLVNRDFSQFVGMTPVQYSVFSLIATNPGVSQVGIGDALHMDRASTMAVVRKLESAGLIDCRKSTDDRRRQALHLTPAGEKEFKVVDKRVLDYDDEKSSRLTVREKQQLVTCIAKLRY